MISSDFAKVGEADTFQVMTSLADALSARKALVLRRYSTYGGRAPQTHQFVGTLMVPKRLDDGSYPVVDVWTKPMSEVVIAPAEAAPSKLPRLVIGTAELSKGRVVAGKRLLQIDTAHGVEPVGYGFGFALYAAAALSAKFAGPDGICSSNTEPGERSIDADELWERMQRLSFNWTTGPIARRFMGLDTVDYILGQSVLDSGLVVRLGQKYGKQWASFRKPPTTDLAWNMKFKAKKLDAWEKYAASHTA